MTNDSLEYQQGDQRGSLDRQRSQHIEPAQREAAQRVKTFHIDGAGMRPDGTGSGYAWVNIKSGEQRVRQLDGLTNNVSEYRALISALRNLEKGDRSKIFTDSMLVCEQFNRRWKVKDQKLMRLLERVRELIEEKELKIEVQWIPRGENVAGKLLERQSSTPTAAGIRSSKSA